MIWHIFRKDCRVLRFAIAGAALAHTIAAATWIAIGPFEQGSSFATMAYLLSSLAQFWMVLTIVMAVHEDPLIGVARDWSVRPISRRDMLLAKVVFALIAAHGPLLIVDFIEALAFGFPVTQAIGAAAARGLAVFCSFTVPALVIAAFTRTMTTWIGAALIWTIGTTLLLTTISSSQRVSIPLATMDVLGWIPNVTANAVILCGGLIALPLIYARKFVSAAVIVLAAPLFTCLALLVPWNTQFEIQRSLSPRDELTGDVRVDFDAGQFRTGRYGFGGEGYAVVFIPLRLSGLADDRMLVIDNATVRLIVDGSTVYQRDDTRCIRAPTRYGSGIVCGPRDPVSAAPGTGTASAFFQLNLPFDVYERVRDRPLQIEIDFALTLLGRTGKATVAGRERQWFDVGDSRCLAQRDASGWEVQLHCLHTTRVPACRRTLIDTGIEHSIRTECRSDYAPFVVHKFPDVIDRGTPAMSAAQILGMNPSPQLGPDSSVRLETYAPRAYFRRSIAIPSIRFSDQIANAESRRAVLRQ